MSKLSEALAAMDKATPGPWNKPYYDDYPGDRGWWIHNGEKGADEYAVAVTFEGNPKAEHDAIVLAAAPDALAWIKEALPWLEIRADELRYEIDAQETLIGPVLSDDCIGTMKSDLARLDAIIARAKPEGVGK